MKNLQKLQRILTILKDEDFSYLNHDEVLEAFSSCPQAVTLLRHRLGVLATSQKKREPKALADLLIQEADGTVAVDCSRRYVCAAIGLERSIECLSEDLAFLASKVEKESVACLNLSSSPIQDTDVPFIIQGVRTLEERSLIVSEGLVVILRNTRIHSNFDGLKELLHLEAVRFVDVVHTSLPSTDNVDAFDGLDELELKKLIFVSEFMDQGTAFRVLLKKKDTSMRTTSGAAHTAYYSASPYFHNRTLFDIRRNTAMKNLLDAQSASEEWGYGDMRDDLDDSGLAARVERVFEKYPMIFQFVTVVCLGVGLVFLHKRLQ